MGCSLCTIQRSDEHYKQLQSTCQVNGSSLSVATHDQAVEAFQTAKAPIEVQVLRRTAHKHCKTLKPAREMDNSTQTNITLKTSKHIENLAKSPSPSSPHMALLDSFLSPSQYQMARCDSPYPSDFHDGVQKDNGSTGLEYEEVDLQRKTTQDKLGLKLCYKTDDEKSAIYISEIDPEGIAAKDGRIQEGDRIIQINEMDIQSHEEAVTLLTKVESKNVTLLVARPESQVCAHLLFCALADKDCGQLHLIYFRGFQSCSRRTTFQQS